MKAFSSCKEAIAYCLEHKTFAVARLFHEEKTMNIHIHDCYEMYYSIAGGKQFLINDQRYEITAGDLFAINNYESHYLSQVDAPSHERVVISVAPEYLRKLSTSKTDLSECFLHRPGHFSHRIHLDKKQHKQFLYFIHKITRADGYGEDIACQAAFLEMMVMVNGLYRGKADEAISVTEKQHNESVDRMISFINQNISEHLTIPMIAEHCFLSEAYSSRLFKAETGTTINKYITARRISIAKAKLAEGSSVGQACELSGFQDYTNFVRVFHRTVGVTPKHYSKYYAGQ